MWKGERGTRRTKASEMLLSSVPLSVYLCLPCLDKGSSSSNMVFANQGFLFLIDSIFFNFLMKFTLFYFISNKCFIYSIHIDALK